MKNLEESIDLTLDALLAGGVEHLLEAVVPGKRIIDYFVKTRIKD